MIEHRTLFAKLLVLFLAFGGLMTGVFIVVMRVSHEAYHLEFDQTVNRDLALRNYFSDPDEWCNLFKVRGKHPPGLWRAIFPISNDEPDEEALSPERIEVRLQKFFPKAGRYHVEYVNVYPVSQRVAANLLVREPPLTAHNFANSLHGITAINPNIDVYVLDAGGGILAASVSSRAIVRTRVELQPIARFLTGRNDYQNRR